MSCYTVQCVDRLYSEFLFNYSHYFNSLYVYPIIFTCSFSKRMSIINLFICSTKSFLVKYGSKYPFLSQDQTQTSSRSSTNAQLLLTPWRVQEVIYFKALPIRWDREQTSTNRSQIPNNSSFDTSDRKALMSRVCSVFDTRLRGTATHSMTRAGHNLYSLYNTPATELLLEEIL